MDQNQLNIGLHELNYEIRRLEFELLGISSEDFHTKPKGKSLNVAPDTQPFTCNAAVKKMLGLDVQPTFDNAMRYYLRRCPNGSNIYKKAAYRLFLVGMQNNDDPKARFGVALCKYWGHGTSRSLAVAERTIREKDFEQIERLVRMGDAEAIIIKYMILYHKLFGTRDMFNDDVQQQLLIRASNTANPTVLYFAGMRLFSVKVLERAALYGSVAACTELGDIYYYGRWYKPFYINFNSNVNKAREYYSKGASRGDAFCKKRLSELEYYEQGFCIYGGVLERFISSNKIINSLTLPDIVTSISDKAFEKLHIETLVLPDTIKSISKTAFLKCHVPNIVSNVINTKGFKNAVIAKRISKGLDTERERILKRGAKAMRNLAYSIGCFFADFPRITISSFIIAIVATLTALFVHFELTNLLPTLPLIVSLACSCAFLVASIIAGACSRSISKFIVPFIGMFVFAFFSLFGGYIYVNLSILICGLGAVLTFVLSAFALTNNGYKFRQVSTHPIGTSLCVIAFSLSAFPILLELPNVRSSTSNLFPIRDSVFIVPSIALYLGVGLMIASIGKYFSKKSNYCATSAPFGALTLMLSSVAMAMDRRISDVGHLIMTFVIMIAAAVSITCIYLDSSNK